MHPKRCEMATRKKRQKTKVKFELSRSGIGSIGIVCFCPPMVSRHPHMKPSDPVVTGFKAGSVQQEQPVIHLEEKKKIKP